MKMRHVSTRITEYDMGPVVEVWWDEECVAALSAPCGEDIEDFGMQLAQLDPAQVIMCGFVYMLTHSPDAFNECATLVESPAPGEDGTQRR